MSGIGQMHLGAVKFVDLKASKIDDEKSDPKKGIYVFKDKKYVDYTGKTAPRPQHHLTWCRDKDHDLAMQRATFGYEPVKAKDGLYWPEGAVKDASGTYKFGDVILVQCDFLRHLRRKLEEKKLSERGASERFEGFQNKLDEHGARVSQDVVDKLV